MSMYLYNGHKFPAHPKTGEEGFDFSFIVLHDKYAELIIANKKGNFYPDGDGYYYAVKKLDAEPVAFLYNGVRLPVLPEWDKTVYPYGIIHTDPQTNQQRLRITKVPLTLYDNNNDGNYTFSANTGMGYEGFVYDGTDWVYQWGGNPHIYASGYIWSNYDIIDTKGLAGSAGSVYREGTDPIPVYE